MILIDDKIISDDVVEVAFVCNLEACKGACCWEGDFGAPLEQEELAILDTIYEKIKPYLTKKGQDTIEEKGKYVFYEEQKEMGTPLMQNQACAYMTMSADGKAQCGIEQAYLDGAIDYKKPISCHLYPIRINKYPTFEAINYDKWDICSEACKLGKKLQVPVYQFLKEPLIKKYGQDFYDELEAAAGYIQDKQHHSST